MTKSILSVLFVSVFAVTALLASVNKAEISYYVDEELNSATNIVIEGYLADEIWEYPPINTDDSGDSNEKELQG